MRTNKFLKGGLIGVHASSIVIEVIKTISSLFIIFFDEKVFARTKTRQKQKSANKTKKFHARINF